MGELRWLSNLAHLLSSRASMLPAWCRLHGQLQLALEQSTHAGVAADGTLPATASCASRALVGALALSCKPWRPVQLASLTIDPSWPDVPTYTWAAADEEEEEDIGREGMGDDGGSEESSSGDSDSDSAEAHNLQAPVELRDLFDQLASDTDTESTSSSTSTSSTRSHT